MDVARRIELKRGQATLPDLFCFTALRDLSVYRAQGLVLFTEPRDLFCLQSPGTCSVLQRSGTCFCLQSPGTCSVYRAQGLVLFTEPRDLFFYRAQGLVLFFSAEGLVLFTEPRDLFCFSALRDLFCFRKLREELDQNGKNRVRKGGLPPLFRLVSRASLPVPKALRLRALRVRVRERS